MGEGVFSTFMLWLNDAIAGFPDGRTKENCLFEMRDATIGAFSVFHMQCRSFLEHQKWLEERSGAHNVLSIYSVTDIPTDTHIKRMLDPVSPEHLFSVYLAGLSWLKTHHTDVLTSMQQYWGYNVNCFGWD